MHSKRMCSAIVQVVSMAGPEPTPQEKNLLVWVYCAQLVGRKEFLRLAREMAEEIAPHSRARERLHELVGKLHESDFRQHSKPGKRLIHA